MSILSLATRILILWLISIPALAVSAETPESTLTDLIKNIEEKYASWQDLQMNYKKEVKSEIFMESERVAGRIFLKQPNKYRLDSPDQIVISDGRLVWTYLKDTEQVTKQNLQPGQEFSFLSFLKDLRSKYDFKAGEAQRVEGVDCRKIFLAPKQKGTDFEKLTLWVDGKTYLVRKMELEDLQRGRTTFWFAKIRINSKLKNEMFQFKIPDEAELIDLTK